MWALTAVFPGIYDTFWNSTDDPYKFIGELGDNTCLETRQNKVFFVCMCVIAKLSMSPRFVEIYIIYFKEG